jgi:hypothetical protein
MPLPGCATRNGDSSFVISASLGSISRSPHDAPGSIQIPPVPGDVDEDPPVWDAGSRVMRLPPAAGRLAIKPSAPSRPRIVGLFAVVVGSLVLSSAAGAGPDRSQAGFRLTGEIEVHANLAQDALSLTFSSRAQFDVTLTTNPDEFATVPMAYDWTGVRGSCRWGGTGSNGELRMRLIAIRTGRPLVEFSGSTAYPEEACNEHPSSVSFSLYTGDDDERDGITPQVYWANAAGSIEGRGTGTLSLQCAGCGAPPGGGYQLRALWGRRIAFTPTEPRTGRLVRMALENVLLLEKSSRDTAWSQVKGSNVRVKCDVYYTRSRRDVRKTRVRGRWRTRGDAGEITCGPWRIPKSARGSQMGVTPLVTYRGKTVTPVRGRGFVLVTLVR